MLKELITIQIGMHEFQFENFYEAKAFVEDATKHFNPSKYKTELEIESKLEFTEVPEVEVLIDEKMFDDVTEALEDE